MSQDVPAEELEGAAGGFDETPALHALPPRRQRFVEEYLVDLNQTAAARRAGYSELSFHVEGNRLLRNALVRAAIDEGLAILRANRSGRAEKLRRELEMIAHFDIGDVIKVNEQGVVQVVDLTTVDGNIRRGISEITQTSTERYEQGRSREDGPTLIEKVQTSVKPHNKLTAIKMLLDLEGFVAPQRVEHTGKDGGPIRTASKHGLTEGTRLAIVNRVLGVPVQAVEAGDAAGQEDMGDPEVPA